MKDSENWAGISKGTGSQGGLTDGSETKGGISRDVTGFGRAKGSTDC